MRGFIYLDVVGRVGGTKSENLGENGERDEKKKNLAEPQKLLKQHVKNLQFFNS